MARAIANAAGPAVVIGSDCPGLEPSDLCAAFHALANGCDAVFGPAVDGGYYLVGLARPIPDPFAGIPWGTGEVLQASRAAADRLGLRTVLLRERPDVDRPGDLPTWRAQAAAGEAGIPPDAMR